MSVAYSGILLTNPNVGQDFSLLQGDTHRALIVVHKLPEDIQIKQVYLAVAVYITTLIGAPEYQLDVD